MIPLFLVLLPLGQQGPQGPPRGLWLRSILIAVVVAFRADQWRVSADLSASGRKSEEIPGIEDPFSGMIDVSFVRGQAEPALSSQQSYEAAVYHHLHGGPSQGSPAFKNLVRFSRIQISKLAVV